MYLLIFAQLCLSLRDFDEGFTDVIAVGIFLTIASFLDQKLFSSRPVELLFEQPVYSRPLEGWGGGGVCTVTQAIFLYFATFFVLAPCRMPLDNGTCAKIEQIFGYLYFIFILLIQLLFSYRAWQGRGATSPLAWSLLGAILQLQKLILRICIRALWE